ncbi:hypothetical protein JM946_13880 [Steroidobacter sp. S1-65]|uniref:Uncharacterized protein n=1 Tax=Steroidobacter gossypii TaxID=2805490 RepID=A0ABS1WXW9_9GAMM|nr:hypothetical protein [Steroidobacter gossypii]MBM0105825.1 hypothetical protein [Steroidobacter gossypii]
MESDFDRTGIALFPRLLVLAVTSILSACGTTYTAAVMDDLDGKHRKTGVRYYLPQDLIQVTVQVQTRPQSEIVRKPPCHFEPCYKVDWELKKKPPVVEPLDVSVELMTVADTSHVMLFDTNGVAFGKSDSTVTVSEHGLLQGINARTQGTSGTVVQNLMKFVATAAALPSLGASTLPVSFTPSTSELKTAEGVEAALKQLPLRQTPATDEPAPEAYISINAAANAIDPTIAELTMSRELRALALLDPSAITQTDSRCHLKDGAADDEFMAHYVTDSKVLRFGFQELPQEVARRLRTNVCNSLDALRKSEDRLRAAQADLARASTRDQIYVATRKVSLLRSEYQADLASANAAASELRTEAEALAKQRGYGGAASIETKKYTMELSRFPSSTALKSLKGYDLDTLKKAVLELIQENEADLAFQRAFVVLSLDDVQLPSGGATYNPLRPSRCGLTKVSQSDACIYHRVARPMRLTGWTVGTEKAKDDSGKDIDLHVLKPISSRVVDVIDSRSIVQAIDLHSSAWTKRDFAVQFTPQGRLVSLRRDYGSAAEDASGALQQSLSAGLSQYQSSLGTVKSIRETDNALELMPYQQQLALTTTQNQLQLLPLQQQLALGNAQSALTLQPINAQLAQASAQLNLIKAQASLEANQGGYAAMVQAQIIELERTLVNAQQQLLLSQSALSNQPTTAQTATLLAELAHLKSEIELIKIRKELEELRN